MISLPGIPGRSIVVREPRYTEDEVHVDFNAIVRMAERMTCQRLGLTAERASAAAAVVRQMVRAGEKLAPAASPGEAPPLERSPA